MSRIWVVCYDIADDRRRSAVAEFLEGRGERVQESVFELVLDSRALEKLRSELGELCVWTQDSVRYYPLCGHCRSAMAWQGRGGAATVPDFFLV